MYFSIYRRVVTIQTFSSIVSPLSSLSYRAGLTLQSSRSVRTMTTIEDVYRLLEEKENDLQLAGELGKVLLDKNEELTREYDRASQDYHGQVEVCLIILVVSERLQCLTGWKSKPASERIQV